MIPNKAADPQPLRSGGSPAGQLPPRDPDLLRQGRPPAPSTRLIVFDSFSEQPVEYGDTDLTGDGIGDGTHGEAVAHVLSSQLPSQIPIERVNVDQNLSQGETIIGRAEQLLCEGKSLTGTYINISVPGSTPSPEEAKRLDQVLLQMANRGAKIFIAAGNTENNPLATVRLANHRNITVVGAQDAEIGTSGVGLPPSPGLVHNPATEVLAPGRIRGGPLTGAAPSTAFNDEARAIEDKTPQELLAPIPSEELRTGGLPKGLEGKVFRASDLIEQNLLTGHNLEVVRGLSAGRELNTVYLSAEGFSRTSADTGMVLIVFAENSSGRLERRVGSVISSTATSFAAPNALAAAVRADLANGKVSLPQ